MCHVKGMKQWAVELPGSPVASASVSITSQALQLVAVAVTTESGGSVLLYAGPQLMHSFHSLHPVSALIFGQYGREEHALVMVTDGKYLDEQVKYEILQVGQTVFINLAQIVKNKILPTNHSLKYLPRVCINLCWQVFIQVFYNTSNLIFFNEIETFLDTPCFPR